MGTTPNMNLVLPVDGGSNNVWNVILDQVFSQIDVHNHTAGLGVQVPSLGLNINADLSFGGNSPFNQKASVFTPQAAASVASYSSALFVNSADRELYFRNSVGQNVQLTAGGSVFSAGPRTLIVPPMAARTTVGGAATVVPGTMSITISTDTNPIGYTIPIEAGVTITGWTLFVNKTTNGANLITAQLNKVKGSTGAISVIGLIQTNTANNPGFITMGQAGLSYVAIVGEAYQISFIGGGAAGDVLFEVEVNYTR